MRLHLSPFQVTRIKGIMIIAIRKGRYVTCNMSQFKKIVSDIVEPELPDDDTLDTWEDVNRDIEPLQGNSRLHMFPLNPPQPVYNRCYPVRIKCPVPFMDSKNNDWNNLLLKKGRNIMFKHNDESTY